MRTLFLIAKKEIDHGLNSQVAYLLVLIFVISLPVPLFWTDTRSNLFLGGQADLRVFFRMLPLFLMVFVPALAMRTWAEERHAGTIETLLTFPIRERDLVLGKFLGNYLLLCACLLATITIPILVAQMGELDWGPVIGGYCGALLLAACCLAVSMLTGALTRNQVTAFVSSFLVLALAMFTNFSELNPHARFLSIARGVIDSRDLVFYLLSTWFFLYLNVKLLSFRR